jgi:hypothetical protein
VVVSEIFSVANAVASAFLSQLQVGLQQKYFFSLQIGLQIFSLTSEVATEIFPAIRGTENAIFFSSVYTL